MPNHLKLSHVSKIKSQTIDELLEHAEHLSLGRLLFLTRTAFDFFQKTRVRTKLGEQGIIRETPNGAIKKVILENMLNRLNVEGPLKQNLTACFKNPKSITLATASASHADAQVYPIDDKTWINLIYAILKDFILKTNILIPTHPSIFQDPDNNSPVLLDYCHQLLHSDQPDDQVKAEIIYNFIRLALTITKKQKAAQMHAVMQDSHNFRNNQRLDIAGISIILAPTLSHVLWDEIDSLQHIDQMKGMIEEAITFASKSGLLSFSEQFKDGYNKNTSLILHDGREIREQLYQEFGALYRETIPLYSEIKKAPTKIEQLNRLLNDTSMSRAEIKLIFDTFNQHQNKITQVYIQNLDQLKRIHKDLVRARKYLMLCESDRTTAEETILSKFQSPNSKAVTLFPIVRTQSQTSHQKIHRVEKFSKSTGDLPDLPRGANVLSLKDLTQLLEEMADLKFPEFKDNDDDNANAISADSSSKP